VALNCAAFNAGTLQSELFGATRGAYTSSVQERSGAFERAHGGTLLLDEIGELSAEAQASLLRVLESGEIQVVGGPVRRVDVRLVAATHRDLGREVTAGRFRADLLHRLTVTQVELPPLRRRGRDRAALLERFLSDRPLPAGADSLLDGRRWLGNVRELRNVARRLELRVGEGAVLLEDLANCFAPESAVGEAMPLTVAMGKAERVARLLVSEPSVSAAWRRSGLSRTTFYRYVRLARRTSEEVQIQPEPPVIAA
jgi:transcriptional regulator with GAF, ATPase, and Fis domain